MKKRLLSILLVLCLMLSALPLSASAASGFSDVPSLAYYANAVKWAVDNNITNGTGYGKFSPNTNCTRAQAVTFLWRSVGSPAVSGSSGFSDVPNDAYYSNAVKWAVQNGIANGTGNGKFSPDAACTRGQIVTFLYRTAGSSYIPGGNSFSDVPSGKYYTEAVDWAVSKSITLGTGNGKFSPNNNCTRAQIVTFLYRNVLDGIKQDALAKAKEQADKGNYEEAVRILNTAIATLGNDSELISKMYEYRDKYPVSLKDVTISSGENYWADKSYDSRKDIYGNVFYKGLLFESLKGGTSITEYVANKNYNRFTGKVLVSTESDDRSVMRLCVYVDDVLEFDTGKIGKKDSPIDLDLDISGVTFVRIEVTRFKGFWFSTGDGTNSLVIEDPKFRY